MGVDEIVASQNKDAKYKTDELSYQNEQLAKINADLKQEKE